MEKYKLITGKDRIKVSLSAYRMGDGFIISIFNENAHIGAVAVGEYDLKEKRVSCSVLTRLGHKDDAVAYQAAHAVSKCTKKPVCVVAGIHLDKITESEIDSILKNAKNLVSQLCRALEVDDASPEKSGGPLPPAKASPAIGEEPSLATTDEFIPLPSQPD